MTHKIIKALREALSKPPKSTRYRVRKRNGRAAVTNVETGEARIVPDITGSVDQKEGMR